MDGFRRSKEKIRSGVVVRATRFVVKGWSLFGATAAAALAVTLLLPTTRAGHAEGRLLTLIGGFKESYLVNPKVSGTLLVGLNLNGGDGRFDPASVDLNLPEVAKPETACVTVSTKDGRYSAENLYFVQPGGAGARRVPMSTRFGALLQGYTVGDVAVLARVAGSCEDPSPGILLPATLNPLGSQAAAYSVRTIVALVNADPARVTVSIAGQRGSPEARCGQVGEGVRISFSARCELPVPSTAVTGRHTLVLTVRERFASASSRYELALGH